MKNTHGGVAVLVKLHASTYIFIIVRFHMAKNILLVFPANTNHFGRCVCHKTSGKHNEHFKLLILKEIYTLAQQTEYLRMEN